MPRIASKHPGFAISHSHRDALSTCWHEHIACTHTAMFSISHTHQNTPGDCLRKPGFSSSDDINTIPLVMKDSLSAIPSSSSVFSLAQSRPLNHTSPISVRTFLLFPRQQWKKILPRRTQPMALAVVWVLVLSGSVELAACVCACFRSESIGGNVACVDTHSCIRAWMHLCRRTWRRVLRDLFVGQK